MPASFQLAIDCIVGVDIRGVCQLEVLDRGTLDDNGLLQLDCTVGVCVRWAWLDKAEPFHVDCIVGVGVRGGWHGRGVLE